MGADFSGYEVIGRRDAEAGRSPTTYFFGYRPDLALKMQAAYDKGYNSVTAREQKAANPLPEPKPAPSGNELLRAADFVNKAAEYVGGDRARTHGDKGLNFRTTAILHDALDAAIAEAVASGRPALPGDQKFALKMILAKMSRILSGAYNPDNFVDMAGYAGCAGEIAAMEEERRLDRP